MSLRLVTQRKHGKSEIRTIAAVCVLSKLLFLLFTVFSCEQSWRPLNTSCVVCILFSYFPEGLERGKNIRLVDMVLIDVEERGEDAQLRARVLVVW